jgi:hypothetical protein
MMVSVPDKMHTTIVNSLDLIMSSGENLVNATYLRLFVKLC